jgi:lipopolysaccharide export system protein LptA
VTVNFRTGDVEFRGNAELTNEFIKKARANVITINLDTQKATLGPGGRIEEFMLNRDRENESGEPAGARP